MKDGPNIAKIAALLGDATRTDVLTALMADRALTASELATIAGVTKQTMSAHLSKLLDASLIAVDQQGRHRYFRLADEDVAGLLESLMGVAFRTGAVRLLPSPREPALRKARVCYDHLAGELGVLAYESMVRHNLLEMSRHGLRPSAAGIAWCKEGGIDIDAVSRQRRIYCRACMDWSERRYHLAGSLGAALLARLCELGWARRDRASRVIHFAPIGESRFRNLFRMNPGSSCAD
jgi:DNA-binding transcriptional ArsR family regulator